MHGDMFKELDQARVANKPRPGYFKRRLEPRSQIWLPGSIYNEACFDPVTRDVMDRPLSLAAEFCGEPCEVDFVWWFPKEITKEEYEWLTEQNKIRTSQ